METAHRSAPDLILEGAILRRCCGWFRFGTGRKKPTVRRGCCTVGRGNARHLGLLVSDGAFAGAKFGLRRGEGSERVGPWWWSAVMAGCVIDAERSGHRTSPSLSSSSPHYPNGSSTFLPRCRGSLRETQKRESCRAKDCASTPRRMTGFSTRRLFIAQLSPYTCDDVRSCGTRCRGARRLSPPTSRIRCSFDTKSPPEMYSWLVKTAVLHGRCVNRIARPTPFA